MAFMNDFEELESLLNLQKMLLFCRDRNGLHTKALKSTEFGLCSASALMEEGLAWKRLKEEALEETAIGEALQKGPGEEGLEEMMECLRQQEEELRRSYKENLREKLSTIVHLERLIQASIHDASVESFRRRHLLKLHRNAVGVCPTGPETRRDTHRCLDVPTKKARKQLKNTHIAQD